MTRAVEDKLDAVTHGLGHPLRRRLLVEFAPPGSRVEDGRSPNELAKMVKEPLTNVSYHVRQLQERGLIKLVDEQPRRGALEHYYQLTKLGVGAIAIWEFAAAELVHRNGASAA